MPELAEVEITRRNLAKWSTGALVTALSTSKKIRSDGHVAQLNGHRLVQWRRHGKLLLANTDGEHTLLCHLGMTGKWIADAPTDRPHQHLVLTLSDAPIPKVSFIDPRRFGFVSWVSNADVATHPRMRSLGPDPLNDGLDGLDLERIHGKSKAGVWRRLLDQKWIAGIGNIMAVDACYSASVHPERPCNEIKTAQWLAIWDGILGHIDRVLEHDMGPEIEYLSSGRPSYFRCYGREGAPCHRCQTALTKSSIAKRPIYFCPSCQRR